MENAQFSEGGVDGPWADGFIKEPVLGTVEQRHLEIQPFSDIGGVESARKAVVSVHPTTCFPSLSSKERNASEWRGPVSPLSASSGLSGSLWTSESPNVLTSGIMTFEMAESNYLP